MLLLCAMANFFGAGCSNGNSDGHSDPLTRDVHTTRCITDVSALDRHEFLCDGVQFKVLLTQACIDRACGVIVDVHGLLSNADQQEMRSNIARAAAQNGGYIVIQPAELSSPSNWQPDLHYPVVFDFLQQTIDAFDADTKRIHITGFSQGGRMSWQFACDYAEVIASIAPLSANDESCSGSPVDAADQVSVLFISGTRDPFALYYKSMDNRRSATEKLVSLMHDYGMATTNAQDYPFDSKGGLVLDEFGKLDITTPEVRFDVVSGNQEGSYFWTRYTKETGVVIEHLRHSNGHVYPDNPDSALIPEQPSVWFPIGEAILQFFIANPKQ
jgi:pimeloyl-ACP methyl ester carboxylesterase